MTGKFHLDTRILETPPKGALPVLRYAQQKGVGLPDRLWQDGGTDDVGMLHDAHLRWRVDERAVLVPSPGRGAEPVKADHYKALVRPDTDEVMSVVSSTYRVAENDWVSDAALMLARQTDRESALVGVAGFGRTNERTIFAVRVRASEHDALVLLAYNTHGGEGAVRFQLVEADRRTRTVLTPDVPHASASVPHVGDVEKRLKDLVHHRMVEQYLTETEPVWGRLADRLWSPRHTKALVLELFGKPRPPAVIDGRTLEPAEQILCHPSSHLTDSLDDYDDAASAYRRICYYFDNESEARERGDFTKDRDERLALGAGLRLKQRAWQWIVANT